MRMSFNPKSLQGLGRHLFLSRTAGLTMIGFICIVGCTPTKGIASDQTPWDSVQTAEMRESLQAAAEWKEIASPALWKPEDATIGGFAIDPVVPPHGEIGTVSAARFSPAGSRVVVLDAVAPHVKVFDRAGSFLTSFGKRGRGIFSTAPSTLGLTDSLIFVLNHRGVARVFDHAGEPRGPDVQTGIYPLAAAWFCNRWLVHGPGRSDSLVVNGRRPWLWALRANGTGAVPLAFDADSIRPRVTVPGGIAVRDNRAIIRHGFGSDVVHFLLECNGAGSISLTNTVIEKQITMPIEGTFYPTGIAPTGAVLKPDSGLLLVDMLPTGQLGFTRLALSHGGTLKWAMIDHPVWLADGDARRGFLFVTNRPVPQLHIVASDEIRRSLESYPAR